MTRNLGHLAQQPLRRRTAPAMARVTAQPALLANASELAPRVVPIYWDPHFQAHADDVAAFDEFLRVLFRSSWMSALAERGILPAELEPSLVPRDPAPERLSLPELEARLRRWLAGPLSALTKREEGSLLVLVITPLGTELEVAGSPVRRFSGYHGASRGGAATAPTALFPAPNLFYALVPLVTTAAEILEVHSLPLSQVLARALIARGRGR
jgi:hypothetical protein